VSDPTTPANSDDRVNDVPTEDMSAPDSAPIDVNELLESTRKLFEPEELQRSLEQAGYTPEPSVADTDESVDDVEESDDLSVVEGGEVAEDSDTDHSSAVVDTVDEPSEEDASGEDPPLQGVNVLSVVAIVLALALSPLAVVFGYIALGQTRRARQRGETLALWAIGLGWLVFAAWAVLISSLVWIGYQQGITLGSLREFIELFSLP